MLPIHNPWINPWAPSLRKEDLMNYGLHAGTNFVEKADFIGNKYGKSMAKTCAYAVDFFTCLFANPTALFYNSTIGLVRNAFIRKSNRITLEKTRSSWKPTSYKPILTIASIALTLFLGRKGLHTFLSTAPNLPANPSSIPLTSLQHSISSSLVKVMDPSSLGSFPDLRNLTKAGLALLTIAIPVGIFYVWKTKPQPLVQAPDISTAPEELMRACPDFGRQAIEYALGKPREHPELPHPRDDESLLQPPVNKQITYLRNFLDTIVIPDFNKAFAEYRNDENRDSEQSKKNSQALLSATDALMKTSYAISYLALQDLSSFRKRHKEQTGEDLTYAQILTRQDFAAYGNFFTLTNNYHFVRRGYNNRPHPQLLNPQLLGAYSNLFYTESPYHHTWNRLYNDFCQQRKTLVSDEALRAAGGQLHVNWTQEDTRETERAFMQYLGPRPTYNGEKTQISTPPEELLRSYPDCGRQAIEYALGLLRNPPPKTSAYSTTSMKHPSNTQITRLCELLDNTVAPALNKALGKYDRDSKEVRQATDDFMMVSYAISCLTLEDLPQFIKEKSLTYAQILTNTESPIYWIFNICTHNYHFIRGNYSDDKQPVVPKEYSPPFFRPETLQNTWKQLYDHCRQRLEERLREEGMRKHASAEEITKLLGRMNEDKDGQLFSLDWSQV